MRRRIKILRVFNIGLLAVALVFSGCALSRLETLDNTTTTEHELWIREEIVFGSDIQNSGTVTDEDWQQFLGEVVTPRFPQGFSVLSGYGQYLMQSGTIIKEKCWILIIYLQTLTPEKEQAIQDIMTTYKQRFKQESVLRSTSPARVRFE